MNGPKRKKATLGLSAKYVGIAHDDVRLSNRGRMMWQIFHKLFGWHYIEYRDSCTSFIGRVKAMPNGKLRLVTFIGVYDAFLKPDGSFEGAHAAWTPLTWREKCTSVCRTDKENIDEM